MVRTHLLVATCLLNLLVCCTAFAQRSEPPAGPVPPVSDRLKQFDSNGDGKIDDSERRAVREKMRQLRDRPGARTPSGKTELIGDREITEREYASKDGRKIPCVVSMPKGDGPFPVLVTIHGGQGDRDLGYLRTMAAPNPLSPTVQAFNEQPWVIVAVSYRTGDGVLSDLVQEDVIAGIRFAKTLPRTDAARVGVVGGSHGGHLALAAAQKLGTEILCVAALSPWMTDPVVYMTGDASTPPLSLLAPAVRDELMRNGQSLYSGLKRKQGLSDAEARAFIAGHSLEASASLIGVPTLFVTSRGDDQAPHVLIEPMISRMQAAGQSVQVFTAEKSPHGFYWARTVSAARELRGAKTAVEQKEEEKARATIIAFFAAHFAKTAPARSDPRGNPGAKGTSTDTKARYPQPTKGSADDISVRVETGVLSGERRNDVRVFLGVPYAAPPIGELRWKAPQPPTPWSGVRKAVAFGAPALQGESFYSREMQSEDCLTLNIWTPPDASADSTLPVLFWIHGGAFIQGSGAQPRYDGTELAKRGVVVITINYRLGPLGIFAHPALTAEAGPKDIVGNYSLQDMIAALKWVRENIAAFGGNPSNVTISGSSAGGTSCLFLMGMPQAAGLFHKAVIHSSGGMRNIQTLAEAEEAGQRVAGQLGGHGRATTGELRAMRDQTLPLTPAAIRRFDLPVKPIIDGRLVTAAPEEIFRRGEQARIPVLMGGANGESGARTLGDSVATGGAFAFQRQLADDMARVGQPVYLFQLTFVPPQARDTRHAAMHGETVAYAFGTLGQSIVTGHGFRDRQTAERASRLRRGGVEDDFGPVDASTEGRKLSQTMMDYLVAFMRTGVPMAEEAPAWLPYSVQTPNVMVFGNSGVSAR
jgi:para-nitrobenzyl esterase